jgi:pimeloyl-ACP methyl ester carboxylesterase
VAPRAAGAAFDNRAEMPNQRIAAIRAPTLIFHARDDGLQLFRHAEFAAQAIPGARLVSYDRGGHLLLVVEQATIRAQLRRHILAHVDD